jgi:ATP synthase proteolipid subunit
MVLSAFGSAWGTWRAGMGVCHMGIDHPKGVIKNIVPIVMAGVLGIYGLIVAVIITQAISPPGSEGYNTYSVFNGFTHVSFFDVLLHEYNVFNYIRSDLMKLYWLPIYLYCYSLQQDCVVDFLVWPLGVRLV